MIFHRYIISVSLAAAVIAGAGCAVWPSGRTANGGSGESLEDVLAGLVPMPEDGMTTHAGGAYDEYDETAMEAVSQFMVADLSHFNEAGDPLLRSGLIVAISVRVGERLEVEPMKVQVSDNGDISVPLVGTVACGGLTIQQLKDILTERYNGFYRDPEVSVNFVHEEGVPSPWGRVLVQGRVAREGWINIPPSRDLSVSSAIQLCGGYSTSAKKSSIMVHRRRNDGKIQQLQVNLDRVGKKGEIERDIGLLPGDVIYVPESKY